MRTTTAIKVRSSPGEAGLLSAAVPPDDDLVADAVAGDSEAFDELARRHRQVALRTATAVIGYDRAEDVVQDALLLAFRALPNLIDRSKFPGWLASITRFRAIRLGKTEHRRSASRVTFNETIFGTLSALSTDPVAEEEEMPAMLAALERLPGDYAEVIRLHFFHDFPHQKIAEFLDVPVSTIKWRCFRGKELLRRQLNPGPKAAPVLKPECAGCRPEGHRITCRSAPARRGEAGSAKAIAATRPA